LGGLFEYPHRGRGDRVVLPQPVARADGGYRLSKEAIILYSMMNAVTLGAKGIRINCTRPGVTETPILDLIAGNLATQDATQGS
jgi:NAD(P)-dependent dehydrogenase (short-subunit alcohol dehydrogenase family)